MNGCKDQAREKMRRKFKLFNMKTMNYAMVAQLKQKIIQELYLLQWHNSERSRIETTFKNFGIKEKQIRGKKESESEGGKKYKKRLSQDEMKVELKKQGECNEDENDNELYKIL